MSEMGEMSKFEKVLVRVAYVAKLLIALAGMVATALLGLSDLPAGWKFPALVVATVASAVALFKVPNGPEPRLAEAYALYYKSRSQSWPPSGGDIE